MANKPASISLKRRSGVKRLLIWAAGIVLSLAVIGYLALTISPWPSVLLIRLAFNAEADKVNEKLQRHVPAGIISQLNISYDPEDKDAHLDIYIPPGLENQDAKLPVIVWTHGGGWISGNKGQMANYCKILAGKNFIAVSIDYSIAPEKSYPTPLKQLSRALAFLSRNADQYHIDNRRFVLGGDSGGAHISAQVAGIITSKEYAQLTGIAPTLDPVQIEGLLLFCGAYDADQVDLNGSFGWFLKTVMWSYSGMKDFQRDSAFMKASIINYVTPRYPPCYISAGNADPLLSQSLAFSDKLASLKVPVDTLFFPAMHEPALPHEYQFNLDAPDGQKALDRAIEFLHKLSILEK